MGWESEIIVFHLNVPQRLSTAGDVLRLTKMTHPMDFNQPLYPATKFLLNMSMVLIMESLDPHLRNHTRGYPSLMLNWWAILESLNLSTAETNVNLGIKPFSEVATLWQVYYIRPLPWRWGQSFVFTGINMYLGYGFAFSAFNAPANSTVHGFMVWLIHHHYILNNIDSGQETYS